MLRSLVCAALAALTTADFGIGYDSYNSTQIDYHFSVIKQRFSSVRTFQTDMGSNNPITAAAKAGLKIAAGIWLLGDRYDLDLQAVIKGTRANPNTLEAVYVGNEEIANGWSASKLIGVIEDAKAKLRAAGINAPIGTVQVDGDFLKNPSIADHVDILGANIHPFFSGNPASTYDPIQDVKARWTALRNKFGNKVTITETGWPSAGGSFGAHVADAGMSEKLFNDVQSWQQSAGVTTYYFMFHDNYVKGGYEAFYGLAKPDGTWKFGSNYNPPTAAPTAAPTEAPTAAPTWAPTAAPTWAPPTEAPTTWAPPTTWAAPTAAPTTTAAPTQAPTTEAPTTEAPTTAAPTTAAPTPEPTTTPAPTTDAPTTTTPEPTTAEVTTLGIERDAINNVTAPNVTGTNQTGNATDDILYPVDGDFTNSSNASFINGTWVNGTFVNGTDYNTTTEDLIVANPFDSSTWYSESADANGASAAGGAGQDSSSTNGGSSANGRSSANVQANESKGADIGTISGIAVGCVAAVALTVIAVVRYRRVEAIRLEEARKSEARSELAMLSNRSAIMM